MFLDQRPGQLTADVHSTLLPLAEGHQVLLLIQTKHSLKRLLGTLQKLTPQPLQVTVR
jgi:hypothetical protein